MNALVKDVMTADVISVKKDASFEDIAVALRQHRVSAFPVVDGDRVIGVVSESDLLAKLALGIEEDRTPGATGILHWHELEKARAVTAEALMTSPAYAVSPQDSVEQAARIMYKRHVKRLPVIDADGRLAGIVSRTDVLAVFGRTDADIAREIRAGIFAGETHAELSVFSSSAGALRDATAAGTAVTRVQGRSASARGLGAAVSTLAAGADLWLPAGQRVAVTGPSGSGKTTLAMVLLRFLDPSAATDAALRDALRRARLSDWTESLPAGLDTPVGEHGARLSGGQRQRLALARVLLADFPVVIFDEPAGRTVRLSPTDRFPGPRWTKCSASPVATLTGLHPPSRSSALGPSCPAKRAGGARAKILAKSHVVIAM